MYDVSVQSLIMRANEATVTFYFMLCMPDTPLGVAIYHEMQLKFIF